MIRQNLIIIVSTVFLLSQQSLYAFENRKTHPAITERAATNTASTLDDYLKTQIGLDDGINTQLSYNFPSEIQTRIDRAHWDSGRTQRPVLEWLKVGSAIEDTDTSYPLLNGKANIRPRHHFYDPTRNAGLNNKDDNPDWTGWPETAMGLIGSSALVWAVNGTASQDPTTNNQSWQSSRTDFYHSLTEPAKSDREKYLAMTFLDLGCVLHIVEDMGIPAHTRNDFLFAHYRQKKGNDYGEPLEGWIEKMIPGTGSLERWISPGWTPTPKVFGKVSYYFDTNTRDANSYLGDGVSPPDTWGLSESTNYQFLSWTTIFREDTNSLYYFPHPARIHTPEVNESGHIYLAGYGIDHLATQTMSYHYLVHNHLDRAWCTLGKFVCDNYAEVSLPRTVDYTTGLINYFFRGRLGVEPNWADPNIAVLTITNDSNNSGVPQVLKGGVFELYWDNTDGNRAEVNDLVVSGWGTESVLDYNDTVTATFTRQADAAAYTLVYQGDICENPSEPDPYDPNAVAVAVFRPGYPIIAWGRDNEGQVSGVPDGNEFIAVAAGRWHCLALRSDGSLVGWGYNSHGECVVPAGNDYVDISAGQWHSMALKSDGSIAVWGSDNLNQITDKPDGNDFVDIAAGDWHSLAIKSDGTIVGWGGWNTYGECNAPAPDAGTIYIDIAAGTYHSLALQSDGVVKAWGNNSQGQTRIYEGAAGKVHEGVAAGGNYSFLLRDDDVLISWGGGDWYEPDIPLYHYRQADSNDFVAIAAGPDHIMALTSDGKAFDWDWPVGTPEFDYFSRAVPPDVVFIEDIDGGYDFSAALRLP